MSIMQSKKTVYEQLNNVAVIVDPEQRKAALRQLLTSDNTIAIIIQRAYHPNYNFSLPPGPLPETIAKKSNHDERGPLQSSLS